MSSQMFFQFRDKTEVELDQRLGCLAVGPIQRNEGGGVTSAVIRACDVQEQGPLHGRLTFRKFPHSNIALRVNG
jgi:hypothetical protein